MAHAATVKKKYTYEDYLNIPDDQRYELIDGELIKLLSPNTSHQRVKGSLLYIV